MTLGEALYIAYNYLHYDEYLSESQKEAKEVIQNAVDYNLEELIEEAVTLLSQVPKERNQELATTLTMIVEGGE